MWRTLFSTCLSLTISVSRTYSLCQIDGCQLDKQTIFPFVRLFRAYWRLRLFYEQVLLLRPSLVKFIYTSFLVKIYSDNVTRCSDLVTVLAQAYTLCTSVSPSKLLSVRTLPTGFWATVSHLLFSCWQTLGFLVVELACPNASLKACRQSFALACDPRV